MRIASIRVQHFRSIHDATLKCASLTALVGANGAGKSTFLRALEVFYDPNFKISENDFYNRDTNAPIVITVTYCDLSEDEQETFERYITHHRSRLVVKSTFKGSIYHRRSKPVVKNTFKRFIYRRGSGLVVKKEIKFSEGISFTQRYYGQILGNPSFRLVRGQDNTTDKRKQYEELRKQSAYAGLPNAPSVAKVDEALTNWEAANKSRCKPIRSEYQFFGSKEGSAIRLENYTRFLFIPAIRDASVESLDKSKGDTVIGKLMNIVRSAPKGKKYEDAVAGLRAAIKRQRKEISDLLDLKPLTGDLNETMKAFAPNTNIVLSWAETAFTMPEPQVNVQVSEDGYETPIERTGHGVQRAFIIAMLQQLAASSGASSAATSPNTPSEPPNTHLILAIEEPELFQHPSRQRHFARVLYELAHNKRQGIASSVQVLYCTHSPLFVNFDWFEKIRLIRKVDAPAQPKQTSVAMCRMVDIPKMSKRGFSIMLKPAINEGFFAEQIILVEGDGDKAYLEMVARYCFAEPLDAHGIVVIAVGGKDEIIKPLRVFSKFGIPVYPVWDNDIGNAAEAAKNRKILEALKETPVAYPEGIHDAYAIFSPKLEAVVEQEIEAAGIDWHKLLTDVEAEVGSKDLKSHLVISHIVKLGYERGCWFPCGVQIIERIMRSHKIATPPSVPVAKPCCGSSATPATPAAPPPATPAAPPPAAPAALSPAAPTKEPSQ